MIQIRKGTEPKCLEEQRCKPEATYAAPPWDKAALRAALIRDQKAICAFCMQRICNDPLKMKIAHVLTQDEHPERQLDYSNLVGACKGGEGNPPSGQHCDTLQGSASLCFNPAGKGRPVDLEISYLIDGTIRANIAQVDDAINRLLGLNQVAKLKNGRRAAWDRFRKRMSCSKVTRNWIERELARLSGADGGTELEPYCGVVMYFLRKKLGSA